MDIKSIFDRLYGGAEQQWSQGSGGNDEDWQEEAQVRPAVQLPKIPKLWLALVSAFFVFAVLLTWLATFLTDMYWFESQGYETIFWRRITAKWELFFVALIPAFIVYWVNWRLALKNGLHSLSETSGQELALPISKWLLIGVAGFMAVVNAL